MNSRQIAREKAIKTELSDRLHEVDITQEGLPVAETAEIAYRYSRDTPGNAIKRKLVYVVGLYAHGAGLAFADEAKENKQGELTACRLDFRPLFQITEYRKLGGK
ncbi:MAG: hypothetical protein WC852_06080 [Candidatus Nanoarchaeia archaeon]|jgi:hypothetical protein